MTAIETIKELFTLKGDLLESAARSADFTDDEALLRSVAQWAAQRCAENAETVWQEAKVLVAEDWLDLSLLRDFLEIGLKPWKFYGRIFGSNEQYDEWRRTRVLITVHRGAKQIGGSITEISMGRTTVLVDCGSELPGSRGSVRDEDIIKKIFDQHRRYTDHQLSGVLFTHYHGDHAGLMEKIPSDIPIYMDEAMRKILRVLHKHTGNTAMQELLADHSGRIHTFTPGKLFHIGDMNIVPFFVDHSAYRATMYLFAGVGRTILFSGDFRSVGYMGKSVAIIPKLIRENYQQPVDVLLCEGTMLTRDAAEEQLLTEWDVKKEATDFMRDRRQIFVLCSSTNFDSITSICQAAQANNLPIYGSDYIAEMLKTFSAMAGEKMGLYGLPPVKSIKEFLARKDGEYVVLLGSLPGRGKEKAAELYRNYGKGKREYRPYLIYSLWQGYLNPRHPAYDEGLATFVGQFDGRFKYIHSSGHADRDTMAKFITDIAPEKYIVPFHTEKAAGFKELAIEEKYRDMVILPEDGDTIEIP